MENVAYEDKPSQQPVLGPDQKVWVYKEVKARKTARVFRNDYVVIGGARYRVTKRVPSGKWLLISHQGTRGPIEIELTDKEVAHYMAEQAGDRVADIMVGNCMTLKINGAAGLSNRSRPG